MSQENFLINWKFPEFQNPERNKKWYFWATVIGAILLLLSILMHNFLFGLIVILVAVVIFAHAQREEGEIEFGITDDGLVVGEKFFSFKELKHFWIVYEPPKIKNLYFEFKNSIRPRLTIPLQDANPVKVREILKQFIEEDTERDTEPFSEAVGRRLKI